VGSRDGLDTKARGKILFLFRGPNLDQFVVAVSGKMVLVRIRHHAMIPYWEVEVQLHSLLTVLEDMSVQLHAPSAVPLGKESPYAFDRRLGGPQSHSGRSNWEKKSLAPAGN
jgi:hypothetical protein